MSKRKISREDVTEAPVDSSTTYTSDSSESSPVCATPIKKSHSSEVEAMLARIFQNDFVHSAAEDGKQLEYAPEDAKKDLETPVVTPVAKMPMADGAFNYLTSLSLRGIVLPLTPSSDKAPTPPRPSVRTTEKDAATCTYESHKENIGIVRAKLDKFTSDFLSTANTEKMDLMEAFRLTGSVDGFESETDL